MDIIIVIQTLIDKPTPTKRVKCDGDYPASYKEETNDSKDNYKQPIQLMQRKQCDNCPPFNSTREEENNADAAQRRNECISRINADFDIRDAGKNETTVHEEDRVHVRDSKENRRLDQLEEKPTTRLRNIAWNSIDLTSKRR